MGMDIHTFVEVKENNIWKYYDKTANDIFDNRDYHVFSFLADVINNNYCEVIKEPTYTFPDDVTDYVKNQFCKGDDHTISYLTLKELLSFKYDKKKINIEDYNKKKITYREFLGESFFNDIEILKTLGKHNDVRVIFWFDS